MRITLSAVVLVVSLLFGAFPCTAASQGSLPSEVRNDSEFMSWLTSLTEQVSQDEHYQRLPLDTDQQVAEFSTVLHRVFRGQITDAQFMEWIGESYPGHSYEAATILRIMHAHLRLFGR